MADTEIEALEPDPAARSAGNDQTVNGEGDQAKAEVAEAAGEPNGDVAPEDSVKLPSGENPVHTDGGQEKKPEDADKSSGKEGSGRVDSKRDRRGRSDRPTQDRRKFQRKDNVVSDLASQPVTDDPVAVRKQVEFYFSDSNLVTDKFLFEKVEGPKNSPVPVKTIHSFKRMRHFQPFDAVVAALKESSTLDVVEVDGEPCIQRKTPVAADLPSQHNLEIRKNFENASMARSIYAKGFGREEPGTQFELEAFFAQHGHTNSVRLRRTEDKIFKGSVFVEFDSEDTANKFLALDPKPKWRGRDLLIKSKKQYCDEKVAEIEAGTIKPNTRGAHHRGRGGRGGRKDLSKRKRDDEDDRDWRVRAEEDRKNGFRDNRRGGHNGRSSRHDDDGGGGDGDKPKESHGHDEKVPKIGSSSGDDGGRKDGEEAKQAGEVEVSSTDLDSKKRTIEETGGAEEQGKEKKLDTKAHEVPS